MVNTSEGFSESLHFYQNTHRRRNYESDLRGQTAAGGVVPVVWCECSQGIEAAVHGARIRIQGAYRPHSRRYAGQEEPYLSKGVLPASPVEKLNSLFCVLGKEIRMENLEELPALVNNCRQNWKDRFGNFDFQQWGYGLFLLRISFRFAGWNLSRDRLKTQFWPRP